MLPIETRIEAVAVYTDRARITRRGKGRAAAGTQELVVDDLPVDLLPESVRASAHSTAPARLLGTEVTRQIHAAAVEEAAGALQAELETLQDREEALVRLMEALTTRRLFMQTLANTAGEQLARGIAFGRTPVETAATVSAFVGEQLAALDAELLSVRQQRREVDRELNAVKSRLQNLQRDRPSERQRVTVLLALDREAEVELEVSYQVPAASWEPLYDLRLEEGEVGPRLSVSYLAQVTQRTGEAWTGVALTLSTARPGLGTIPPELAPWYLHGRREELALRAMRASVPEFEEAEGIAAMSGAPDTMPAPQVVAAVEETAVVEDTGASVSFLAPASPDIPSDGSPHKVALASHDFPARLDYIAAPKLVSQAYRRARITNTTSVVMLPGSGSIFLGPEFVGGTRLKTVAPGQEFEVFLGVDDRIRVERKLVEGAVDKKLLMDVRRLTYAYEIRVTNLKNRPETVTVLDQLPVSRHESVKVRAGEIRPPAAGQTELGRLSWEVPLAPGQEKLIRFGFTIECPRDMQLAGLPTLTNE